MSNDTTDHDGGNSPPGRRPGRDAPGDGRSAASESAVGVRARDPARVSRRTVLGGLTALAAGGLAVGSAASARSDVLRPTVEGPIEGGARTGRPQGAAPIDFGAYGYVEEEFFLAGEARHDDFFSDGERADDTADYRTRVVVYRPGRRRRFNGSVYAEWLNVSTQVDAPVAWPNGFDSLMRNGTAVALVSAQKVGVDDSALDLDLVTWDPDRYGDLEHPGDEYALSIFAQAVRALSRRNRGSSRRRDEPAPMGRHRVRHALATGHSQSAFFLLRYINLVAPVYGIVDGFVPAGSSLTTARADLAPILWFNSEDEAGGLEGLGEDSDDDSDDGGIDVPTTGLNLGALEPGPRDDEGLFKLWEVAGASHVNNWLSRWSAAVRRRDFQGQDPNFDAGEAGQYGELPDANFGECDFNYFPARWAWRAALEELREWVARGDDPRRADRLQRTTDDEGNVVIERDEFDNALGGLRLPPIDVPVATYDAASCGLTGRTFRLDDETLAELYPTHEEYVDRIRRASARAVLRGHFRPRDARFLVRRAEESPIGE